MPAKASATAGNKKSGKGAVLGREDTEHTNSPIYCQTSTSLAECIMDLLDEMIREKMWSTSIPEMDWNLGNASAYIEKARKYSGEVAMNNACLLGLALAHIEEAFRRDKSSGVCRYVIQHHSMLFGTYRLRQAIATQYATMDSTRSTKNMALTMQTWDMEKLVYISAFGSYPEKRFPSASNKTKVVSADIDSEVLALLMRPYNSSANSLHGKTPSVPKTLVPQRVLASLPISASSTSGQAGGVAICSEVAELPLKELDTNCLHAVASPSTNRLSTGRASVQNDSIANITLPSKPERQRNTEGKRSNSADLQVSQPEEHQACKSGAGNLNVCEPNAQKSSKIDKGGIESESTTEVPDHSEGKTAAHDDTTTENGTKDGSTPIVENQASKEVPSLDDALSGINKLFGRKTTRREQRKISDLSLKALGNQKQDIKNRLKERLGKSRCTVKDDYAWFANNIITCGLCSRRTSKKYHDFLAPFCSACRTHVCLMCDCSNCHVENWDNALFTQGKRESKRSKKTKKVRNKNDANHYSTSKKEGIQAQDLSHTPNLGEESPLSIPLADSSPDSITTLSLQSSPGVVGHDFVQVLIETGSILKVAEYISDLEEKGIDLDGGYDQESAFNKGTYAFALE